MYRFAKGDGQDMIVDGLDRWDGGEGGYDRIEFAAGIATDDVTVTRRANGSDFLLTIAGGDSILIGGNSITNGANTVEEVVFANGTIWTIADLLERSAPLPVNDFVGTSEDDWFVGGAGIGDILGKQGNHTLGGGRGDVYLSGGAGNAIYRFNRGDG